MEFIIEIKNLCLCLSKQDILKNININIEKEKIHGIVGKNGSGKSMLFKCICGFVPTKSDSIIVDGNIIGKDIDFPKDTGILIETPGFIPYYSGYKNLKILADLNKKIRKEEIFKTMELVGLDPLSKKHVCKYSLGMKQRLGIAQAIMENPHLLILDEPMNGLDKKGINDIRQIILELKKEKKTILLTSHNYEDIELLCDDVFEMDNGFISKLS